MGCHHPVHCTLPLVGLLGGVCHEPASQLPSPALEPLRCWCLAGRCVAAPASTGLVVVAAQNTKQRQRLAIKERTYNRQYKSAVRTRMKKVGSLIRPEEAILLCQAIQSAMTGSFSSCFRVKLSPEYPLVATGPVRWYCVAPYRPLLFEGR